MLMIVNESGGLKTSQPPTAENATVRASGVPRGDQCLRKRVSVQVVYIWAVFLSRNNTSSHSVTETENDGSTTSWQKRTQRQRGHELGVGVVPPATAPAGTHDGPAPAAWNPLRARRRSGRDG